LHILYDDKFSLGLRFAPDIDLCFACASYMPGDGTGKAESRR
jgi:hypothetical protein